MQPDSHVARSTSWRTAPNAKTLAPLDEVLEVLTARDEMKHVIVTGRNAPEALMDAADLVTEMTMVKHPFRSGVKAQKGIEF